MTARGLALVGDMALPPGTPLQRDTSKSRCNLQVSVANTAHDIVHRFELQRNIADDHTQGNLDLSELIRREIWGVTKEKNPSLCGAISRTVQCAHDNFLIADTHLQ